MMKLSLVERACFIIFILTAALYVCHPGTLAFGQAGNETKQTATPEQKPEAKDETQSALTPSTVVAKVGEYTITREELEQRMMREIYPSGYDMTEADAEPVEAETVLRKMLAEKAMMIEGRKRGYLKTEQNRSLIDQFKERKLVGLMVQKYVEANEDKIAATEDEIKQKMTADPNVTRERAQAAIRRIKGMRLLDRFYTEIYRKRNVKKLKQNFPKVVQIYQRLLTQPKKPRKVNFIRTWQTREELTQSEKDMVLVQFEGGKVTLKDWFEALCNMSPPSRPRNLNTITGVEQLLNRALRMPLLVAEAKSKGYDKDEDILKEVRDYEDRRLLSEVRINKQKETKDPNDEEIKAYFDQNKKAFETGKNMKVDAIWFENLDTAKKAKAELDSGKDFDSVRQEYNPDAKGKPLNTYPSNEGMFWKELWAGEPNDILGPLKGFHDRKVQWRIVKILEKTPGKPREYSENMNGQIKSMILSERNEALMDRYGKELLEKYPYEIYTDKFKDIDPLNIP